MRERTLENKLVHAVAQRGGVAYKWSAPSNRGVPDRIVFLPGWDKPVFVEMKAPGKKATKLQTHTHNRLRRFKQTVVVIDSVEGIEQLLLGGEE